MNLEGEALRREIDAVLAEIDEVEADVMDLFEEIGGRGAVRMVRAYKDAQANLPRNRPLQP